MEGFCITVISGYVHVCDKEFKVATAGYVVYVVTEGRGGGSRW